MKSIATFFFILLFFFGCSKKSHKPQEPLSPINFQAQKNDAVEQKSIEKEIIFKENKAKILFDFLPNTYLVKSTFNELPNWKKEDYNEALSNFLNSCKSEKTKKMYRSACRKASYSNDSEEFIRNEFLPYKITTKEFKEEGLLTGYYEPELQGSLNKTKVYKYPVNTTPKDLITVDLSSIYPQLKHLRLRGKLEGNKIVPYHTRKQSSSTHIPSDVICYTDSKIDLFFLEVQGSGRVQLQNGETIFIAYDNQNGHRYKSIGKYLVQIGALTMEEVSLQTIRAWLHKNPSRINEVLNKNKSLVYFKEDKLPASGSLGLCLTPSRSIAVDRRYIPLGSMLYLSAKIKEENVSKIVLAQDTGGAIKGAIRADMFLGCGNEAMNTAGELKSVLKLWILLPKNVKEKEHE